MRPKENLEHTPTHTHTHTHTKHFTMMIFIDSDVVSVCVCGHLSHFFSLVASIFSFFLLEGVISLVASISKEIKGTKATGGGPGGPPPTPTPLMSVINIGYRVSKPHRDGCRWLDRVRLGGRGFFFLFGVGGTGFLPSCYRVFKAFGLVFE